MCSHDLPDMSAITLHPRACAYISGKSFLSKLYKYITCTVHTIHYTYVGDPGLQGNRGQKGNLLQSTAVILYIIAIQP